ncbi:MAG: RNA polymerase Rpb4 [Nitrososphaerota archaeon]|nr:RNA polymerase Rpb4 [Nitrososphaerales archaeon]MDW8045169.1 RNA polymerase Rpb4 [Nitrososphaerota archaeon]
MSEIKGRKVLTIPEVKEILDSINLETADQIQKRTVEYVRKFSKITGDEARRIRESLIKECQLTDEEAVELINIMPSTIEEVRVFAAGWKKLLPTETVEKILKILHERRS